MKHYIAGFISLCLGIAGVVNWWSTFGTVMRGVVPFGLILFGVTAVLSGFRLTASEEPPAEPSGARPGKVH